VDGAWADEARDLLDRLNQVIPERFSIIVLADRIHTGEPFVATFRTGGESAVPPGAVWSAWANRRTGLTAMDLGD
jgi:hypothetical protein